MTAFAWDEKESEQRPAYGDRLESPSPAAKESGKQLFIDAERFPSRWAESLKDLSQLASQICVDQTGVHIILSANGWRIAKCVGDRCKHLFHDPFSSGQFLHGLLLI